MQIFKKLNIDNIVVWKKSEQGYYYICSRKNVKKDFVNRHLVINDLILCDICNGFHFVDNIQKI